MTWDAYVTAWSALHGGFDPRDASPVVRGWIRLAWRAGSLLARLGIGPSTVTTAGLLLCLGVPFVPLWAGALLVLLAAFADSFDGAVAVVTGRVSRSGYVYDSVADRLGELAWLAAFWVAGAPGWLVVAALAVSWLHEYLRARAAATGMTEIGTVTVGERPTRVSIAISGLIIAAILFPWSSLVVTAAVIVWLVLGLIGFAQLVLAVRSALTD
ncbi:CDP-alcohol phosphatidyltransferase family protein [Winogradskya consettensis]|uniref:CDP-diacylglycerol--glycerol-3-phosphate 3-phosphatidyltransferase n=1 Tax=Winogradskya consettensis TaxID=113560 RepID=A0A919T4K7_9ACTN|nr:CDP-alcohol phosphatidyltransferase family protein [Actinoplanes consettensis]GIM84721.1 CDP-diacylglycerol--glycerol-3-phosphate 3-phosphatidyltransferase [Actinoplanes consettensis]